MGVVTFTADSEAPTPTTQCAHSVNTTANGDVFEFDADGDTAFDPATGIVTFWGDWEITGGTGRFANATGGGTYEGSASFVTGTGEVTNIGTITY
jgi:hypothetical protein